MIVDRDIGAGDLATMLPSQSDRPFLPSLSVTQDIGSLPRKSQPTNVGETKTATTTMRTCETIASASTVSV